MTVTSYDHLQAEIAALDESIAAMGEEDFLTRESMIARREELQAQLAQVERAQPFLPAVAELFFSGRPVLGQRGIEAEFGSGALKKFQDIVNSLYAYEQQGSIGERGVVPLRSESKLHITGLVHGSFGFRLQELNEQENILNSPLRDSLDGLASVFNSLVDPDDDVYLQSFSDLDGRVLNDMKEFFEFLDANDARLRFSTIRGKASFDERAVKLAAERTRITNVVNRNDTISGEIIGVLPVSGSFEFRIHENDDIIRGRIDNKEEDDASDLVQKAVGLVNEDVSASFEIREVVRNGEVLRQNYKLIGAERLRAE